MLQSNNKDRSYCRNALHGKVDGKNDHDAHNLFNNVLYPEVNSKVSMKISLGTIPWYS